MSKTPVNYLDDFLFAALTKALCDGQLNVFFEICEKINFPVALDKTVTATSVIMFLGLLIDTVAQIISIPVDKVNKAKELIEHILGNKKTTVKMLQKVCGHLNFLCRRIVPGRAFTRRLYSYFSSAMKPHYHVRVNNEMTEDLWIWMAFLKDPIIYCRPFIDFTRILTAEELDWVTDASGAIGFGCICGVNWFRGDWTASFLKKYKPSIEFLELFAVAVSVTLWARFYENRRISLNCDNQSVVFMLNNSSSNCKYCMKLIRHITLFSLKYNVRIFARHIRTELNGLSDALSRGQMKRFVNLCESQGKVVNITQDNIPEALWPVEKFWQ